jgi:hypothetical protein
MPSQQQQQQPQLGSEVGLKPDPLHVIENLADLLFSLAQSS